MKMKMKTMGFPATVLGFLVIATSRDRTECHMKHCRFNFFEWLASLFFGSSQAAQSSLYSGVNAALPTP